MTQKRSEKCDRAEKWTIVDIKSKEVKEISENMQTVKPSHDEDFPFVPRRFCLSGKLTRFLSKKQMSGSEDSSARWRTEHKCALKPAGFLLKPLFSEDAEGLMCGQKYDPSAPSRLIITRINTKRRGCCFSSGWLRHERGLCRGCNGFKDVGVLTENKWTSVVPNLIYWIIPHKWQTLPLPSVLTF